MLTASIEEMTQAMCSAILDSKTTTEQIAALATALSRVDKLHGDALSPAATSELVSAMRGSVWAMVQSEGWTIEQLDHLVYALGSVTKLNDKVEHRAARRAAGQLDEQLDEQPTHRVKVDGPEGAAMTATVSRLRRGDQ